MFKFLFYRMEEPTEPTWDNPSYLWEPLDVSQPEKDFMLQSIFIPKANE